MNDENLKSGADNATGQNQSPLYEYACHPARRSIAITILTTTFLVVCVLLVWLTSYSILLAALAVLILFGSMGGFYFPTRYFFYHDYFVVKTSIQTAKKEWKQYRSFYPDKNGVLLSPFGHPSRLENFRGLYMKFAGNRDRVMEIVCSKIDFTEDK